MENKILPTSKKAPSSPSGPRPVTRGPRNTSSGKNLKKIYQNFDRLEISFQCSIPGYIRNAFSEAKEKAIQERSPIIIRLGKDSVLVKVAESGLKGGYQFRITTGSGEDDIIWAIRDNDDSEQWNVRVIVGSDCLALHGYEESKAMLLDFLHNTLYARPPRNHDVPLGRISRIDYCYDFIDRENSFYPDENRFLVHSRCKKNIIQNIKNDSEIFLNIIHQGKNISTITIGKLPGRQITIYRKSKEIKEKGKLYWWRIWGLKHEQDKYNIWRVEARAGKKELNKYNLKRFSDLEGKAGDVIINILNNFKYIFPNKTDKNRARWPLDPCWEKCIEGSNNHLKRFISHAERKEINLEREEIVKNRHEKQLYGMITSYAAIQRLDLPEVPTVLDTVSKGYIEMTQSNPRKVRNGFKKAKDRFEFLCKPLA